MNLLKAGDGVILLAGLGLIGYFFQMPSANDDLVRIKSNGRVFLESSLRLDRDVLVPGPLGETRVEIRAGRVRVAEDPSPRQLCVRQGWLLAGQSAVCLPNKVSVERGQRAYDSLNY